MTEPMTPEGRARLMADVDRIRDLVEGQSLGALTVPDGRDMEALARVVRDVPDLAAEADASNRARDHVRKKNLDVDRILTEAIKEHVPPQKRPTLMEAATEAARLIRRQAAEVKRLRSELDRLEARRG